MSEDHKHIWKTRYVTFDRRYDCASGMECECGSVIDQDDVENIVNDLQVRNEFAESEGTRLEAEART